MTEAMENVSAVANVVMSTKRNDYQEFVEKLDLLFNKNIGTSVSNDLTRIIRHYEAEIKFIDEQI